MTITLSTTCLHLVCQHKQPIHLPNLLKNKQMNEQPHHNSSQTQVRSLILLELPPTTRTYEQLNQIYMVRNHKH